MLLTLIAILEPNSMLAVNLPSLAKPSNMLPSGRPFWIDNDYRTMRALLCCYLVFLIYASFIPFHFNLDPNFVRWRLDIFFNQSLFRGIRRWSGTDVVTNILVYIPLGLLINGSWYAKHGSNRSPTLPLVIGMAGLFTGFAIELGQTLSPFRSPSMLDAFCNGFGTFIGAALSYRLLPALKGTLGARIKRLIRENPILLLIAFVSLAPILDAFYPFDIKLTIGFFADNLNMTRLTLFHPALTALDLFVERFFSFAALGYLVAADRTSRNLPPGGPGILALTTAFAITLEAAKLFLANRVFQIDNVLFALLGTVVGTALERRVPYPNLSRFRSLAMLTIFAVLLLGYFQMEPFDWISRGELRWKIRQIEWFPFAAYYWSDPRAVLFDLLKKLYLSIPIGLLLGSLMTQRPRGSRLQAVALITLLGVFLEASQILIRSRTAAVTDVLVIATGGWIGALAGRLYDSTKAPNAPPR
jgi:VanZ family protein